MHEKTRLRSWALQADVIATQYCSHHHRNQQITALTDQLKAYMKNNRPLWLETLISLLRQASGDGPDYYTHTEVKLALILFRETCHYLANNLGERWLDYAQESYDTRGYPQKSAPFNKSQDPFTNFVNNLDDTQSPDDDDEDPLDTIPW